MNRNLAAIAEMAPGVTDNGPNIGQVTIGGAYAYDNVFLLNGVDINDNLFGTANNLFIEDALQEISILTIRHLRRIRPLLGRRDQRDHQERRQHVPGQLPHRHHEPRLAGREPGREERDHDAARAAATSTKTKLISTATLGGPDGEGPAVVLRRLPAREQRRRANALSVYRHRLQHRRREPALRGQAHRARSRRTTRLQANYIRQQQPGHGQQRVDQHDRQHRPAHAGGPARLPADLWSSRGTTACSRPTSSPRRSTRARPSGSAARAGRARDTFESPFMSRGQAGHPRRAATTTLPTSPRSTPRTATTANTPAALSYFLSTGARRAPRPQARRRILHVEPHGRQLAVGDRARVLRRTP